MHSEWVTEVSDVLETLRLEMEARLGCSVACSQGHRRGKKERVVPKFTIQLGLSLPDSIKEPTAIIGEMWEERRARYPDLWSYKGWLDAKIARCGVEKLSDDAFADHMKARRNE